MPIDSDDLSRLLLALMKEETKEKQKSALSDLLNPPAPPTTSPGPEGPEKQKEPPPKPKRCMCEGCKTKLSLIDFACKCHGWYCSMHRHAESHSCTFDFKAKGQESLEKQLVKVAGEKLQRV